jgi:hypothetical protein
MGIAMSTSESRAAVTWFSSIPPLPKPSVPAPRPIKPVYVRRFVTFIETVRASNE